MYKFGQKLKGDATYPGKTAYSVDIKVSDEELLHYY